MFVVCVECEIEPSQTDVFMVAAKKRRAVI